MFASAPMGLTVLLLFQAGAQMEAGARVEARAGELPTGTTVMLLATPIVRVVRFAGSDIFQAELASRILWRPVPLPHARPLFLETLGLVRDTRPSPRTEWHLDFHANYGEQDYTSLSQQFSTQPALPLATTMVMVDGATDLLWRSSRLTTLGFHMGAAHRRSLDDQKNTDPAVGASILPTQTMVGAAPEVRIALDRRSTAEISVPFSAYDIGSTGTPQAPNGSVAVYSVQPQVQLLEKVSRTDRLRLVAGLTYAGVASGSVTDFGAHVTPLGLVGLDSDFNNSRHTKLRSSVMVQSSWYMDPVLGRGIWRGNTQMSLDAQMGLRWGAGVMFAGTADISRPPASSTATATDGTLISASGSVRYRWSNLIVAELGGRFAERGLRLGSSDFAWTGHEAWGFFTLYTGSSMPITTVRPIQSISGSGK